MLKLYHADMSTCSQKARLALAEKGVKAEEIPVNLAAGEQKRPEYLKMNPGGYVPTLVHDGVAVPESTVICEYIDDAFAEPPLKPADAAGRSRMRYWTRLLDDALHDACSAVSIAIWMRPAWLKRPREDLDKAIAAIPLPEKRQWRRDLIENGAESIHFASGLLTYARYLREMERALADDPWLAGDTYSLAEIGAAPYLNRAQNLGLDALFADKPNVNRWFAAVRARPSYAKALAAYDNPDTLTFMAAQGDAAQPKVAEILKAAR